MYGSVLANLRSSIPDIVHLTKIYAVKSNSGPFFDHMAPVVKPLVIDDHGKEWGHRSTSCGDYVMVNGKKYMCAMVGWELC